jgi:methionine-rich copper-binding protein CopC
MRVPLELLLVGAVSATLTGTALAHAAYESSEPNNKSTVSSPPSRVIADFTERLSTDNSRLMVFDPCGSQVDNQDSLVANDRITTSMSADKRGTYVVRFEALSAVDGHLTRGQFTFTSTGGQPCPTDPSEEEEEPEQTEPRNDPQNRDRPSSDRSQDTQRDDRTASEARRDDGGDNRTSTGREAPAGSEEDGAGTAPDVAAGSEGEVDLEVEATSIWDGIPMTDFFVALGVAAIIGAGGGRIYAGIMGPRK